MPKNVKDMAQRETLRRLTDAGRRLMDLETLEPGSGYVALTGAQSIAGVKTFSNGIVSPSVKASTATNPEFYLEATGLNLSANQQTAYSADVDEVASFVPGSNTTGGLWTRSYNDGAAGGVGMLTYSYSENDLTTFASFYNAAFKHNGSGALTAHGAAARIWALYNNATLLVMVLGNGNVGIADVAPAEALDVTGNINATGVYKIDDVQVVSNRVIDARADDTVNTAAWDATTAGVLDALRDAMITHGLIAPS